MRDVNRIDGILQSIGHIWKQHPDLRLGQLLLNPMSDQMLYYVEDEKLVDVVSSYYNNVVEVNN